MSELKFTPVIGIEIHIQLKTKTKVFCGCSTDTTAEPNTNICPVCMGLPGCLPRLNKNVVEQGMLAGLALHCAIQPQSLFFRKSYFYPDLPKGFQTSQSDMPVVANGYIEVHDDNGKLKKIRVNHLHLEEDVGRLHHSASDGRLEGAAFSYVDYNRSGMPLAEIVSEPDVSSAKEAVEYCMTLRRRVRYSGASDVDLSKGEMRFDANVSLKCSDGRWGNKTEVKNMNSFHALERAINHEIERQKKIMLSGGEVLRETRHWNDAKGTTTASRAKEYYRKFIVEPDLPPLIISQAWADEVTGRMPEMPDVKAARYVKEFNLAPDVADAVTDEPEVARYFEACVAAGASASRAANWVRTEVLRVGLDKALAPEVLAELIKRVDNNRLSTTQAKDVFDKMVESGAAIDEAVKACGIVEGGVAGSALGDIIAKVLTDNADVVAIIKSGKDNKGKKLKFLQGLVMRETRGRAEAGELASQLAAALGL